MGTTATRGLPYPEGTVSSNTLHTQIKNLADAVDAQFGVVKDTVLGRNQAIGVVSGGTYVNTGSNVTVATYNAGTIPAGTETIDISTMMHAAAVGNGACYWYVDVATAAGGWFRIGQQRCHNNTVTQVPLSLSIVGGVSTAELGSVSALNVRVIVNVDSGGTSLSTGPLNINTVYKGVN